MIRLSELKLPLAEVPAQLDGARVAAKLDVLLAFCRRFQPRPRLVVAGLNPHAGEGGALGREEQDWLIPSLEAWRARHPELDDGGLEDLLPQDNPRVRAAGPNPLGCRFAAPSTTQMPSAPLVTAWAITAVHSRPVPRYSSA